jgi:hypothetical protein
MARLVAHRVGHGPFASYFKRFKVDAEDPECSCGAVAEPEHLKRCLRRRKVVYEAKEKSKLDTENEVDQFFLGEGHKGVGARE